MSKSFKDIFSELNLSTLSIPSIRLTDIIDIFLVAVVIYVIMVWIKETRAWSLFKGVAKIFIISILSYQHNINTNTWIIEKTV